MVCMVRRGLCQAARTWQAHAIAVTVADCVLQYYARAEALQGREWGACVHCGQALPAGSAGQLGLSDGESVSHICVHHSQAHCSSMLEGSCADDSSMDELAVLADQHLAHGQHSGRIAFAMTHSYQILALLSYWW